MQQNDICIAYFVCTCIYACLVWSATSDGTGLRYAAENVKAFLKIQSICVVNQIINLAVVKD